MFSWIKNLWNFLADFSGVVTTLALAIAGITWLLNLLNNLVAGSNIRIGVLLISLIILLISSLFFIKQFIKIIYKFNNDRIKNQVDLSLKEIDRNASINTEKLILPSKKQLELWQEYAQRRAKEWAEDAEEKNLSIPVEVRRNSVSIRPQFCFYSPWKGQELVIIIGSKNDFKKEKDMSVFGEYREPFYKRFTNWNWAVQKGLEKISGKIGNEYILWLYSHYKNFHFVFIYKEKDVEKSIEFDFDGKVLSSEDGKNYKCVHR